MKRTRYTCDNLGCDHSTSEEVTEASITTPGGWITININFYQNNQPTESKRKMVMTRDQIVHFCSNNCFKNYFFYEEEEKEKKQNASFFCRSKKMGCKTQCVACKETFDKLQ